MRIILDAALVLVVIAAVLVLFGAGVVATALWAGWSRDRDCERRGWRNIGRF